MLMLLCAELVNGLKTAKTCCVQSFVLVTDTRKKEKKNLLQQFKSRFLSKMKSNTFLNNVSQCLLKASRCFVTLEMEIRGQSLFLIYTLGQTGGIMGMTLFDPCQKNNSNWRGGESVVSHQHTIHWLDNLFSFTLLKFPFFTVSVEQWEDFNESHTSQVCNYIFTCWQNSSEKVTSCQVLCFQPCLLPQPPPLSTHLSSLSNSLTNGALLDSVWDLSGLVKVGCLSQR